MSNRIIIDCDNANILNFLIQECPWVEQRDRSRHEEEQNNHKAIAHS